MRLKIAKDIADKFIPITKDQIKIDTFCCSGHGGQNINKNETGVRLTHIPTGISAEATDNKSQRINKKKAFAKLIDKLISHFTVEVRKNNSSIGWAEKIRTYNQQRGIVKDHRTGVEQDYNKTLNGDLDKFIDAELIQLKEEK